MVQQSEGGAVSAADHAAKTAAAFAQVLKALPTFAGCLFRAGLTVAVLLFIVAFAIVAGAGVGLFVARALGGAN